MKAKDLMSTKPEILTPETTLKEAAIKMQKKDIGFLPIGENDRLIGVITDRDIAIRGVAAGKDPTKTTVKDIMTSEVDYCFEKDTAVKVADMMSDLQVRRLMVLNDDKRLVGIISLGDFATKSHDDALSGKTTNAISCH
ncbi:MAG: CBS domain-containing protein [Gammaproteobacteria bacterium]|nr:CBS domain-containing protein [Gammaproteobacteria bacterium]